MSHERLPGTVIYHKFHIQFATSLNGGYAVTTSSNRGEGRSTFTPTSDVTETTFFHNSGKAEHDHRSYSLIGEQLFDGLFQGETLSLFERGLEFLEKNQDFALRIELEIDPKDHGLTVLQALPWELLRKPKAPGYMALNRRLSIVRYLAVPSPVSAFSNPRKLRILAVAADPRLPSYRSLDLESELRNLRTAVAPLSNVELVIAPVASLDALREAIRENEFHVLHFMGHGGLIPGQQERVLYFEGKNRSPDPVTGTDLLNKLTGIQVLRLVVLNACESGETPIAAGASGFSPFAGVANSLVIGGLPAVVAMQSPISDSAAIAFSQRFYQVLAAGHAVDSALVEGRQAMHSVDRKSFEWAIPVLLSRTSASELSNNGIVQDPPLLPSEKPRELPAPKNAPRMGKIFDVFLIHNSKDKLAARELAEVLRKRGLEAWLDEWELVPSRPWREALEAVIETAGSSAMLVGKDGIGPWQHTEMRACLSKFVDRNLPVIPVLLPGAPEMPRLPLFLRRFTWIDLRDGLTEGGIDRLQWRATGKRPDRPKPSTRRSEMKRPNKTEMAQVNMGIQAENVRAEVIAVGPNARALKNTPEESRSVLKTIEQLKLALEALNLQPQVTADIAEDLASLHEMARGKHTEPERAGSIMQSLATRLKEVGIVVSEVVALSGPLGKIADWLRVSLHTLGM